MIALTLIVCLQQTPSSCKPQDLFFEGSLMSCTMYGQALAAEWISTHPKYRLKKFSCGTRRLPTA